MPGRVKKKKLMIEWDMYLMLLPGIIFFLVFSYLPMVGLAISFQDFKIGKGFFNSEWIGFAHYQKLFSDPYFYRILWNTVYINILKLVFSFPVPIILALILNELRSKIFKRTLQTITYLPHFLSWVVVAGLMTSLFSSSFGLINQLREIMGFERVSYLTEERTFRSVLVISEVWKTAGWNSIIYFASLMGISPSLYEAATIDGASRFQKMLYISLPGISSTIVIMLILRVGNLLRGGFEQILMLYSPAVYSVADVIPTYVYRVGLGQFQYSYSTAVGLFQSVVGFILVISSNLVAKKVGDGGLW